MCDQSGFPSVLYVFDHRSRTFSSLSVSRSSPESALTLFCSMPCSFSAVRSFEPIVVSGKKDRQSILFARRVSVEAYLQYDAYNVFCTNGSISQSHLVFAHFLSPAIPPGRLLSKGTDKCQTHTKTRSGQSSTTQ